MNDIVSIRKMRPWVVSFAQPAAFEALAGSDLGFGVAAVDLELVDFFCAGTAFSLAAGSRLEIHSKICLNDFVGLAAAGILKDKVVLDWLCDGRWQVEIDCLVVRFCH